MFDFLHPYLDMYKNELRKRYKRPLKIHRATCPHCGGKLLTLYWSAQLEKYICRECTGVVLGEREETNHG